MQPVQTVVHLEEHVQQKQLRNGVDDVHEFDHHVTGNEVIAVEFTADKTADLGNEVLDANYAASAVLSLCQHVTVHLIDHITQGL